MYFFANIDSKKFKYKEIILFYLGENKALKMFYNSEDPHSIPS